MIYIGIDNGVSGAVAIYNDEKMTYIPASEYTKSEQSYTKTRQNITRIDFFKLQSILLYSNTKCLLERPMINPGRFKATVSAIRALESTLIILENLAIPFAYIDSKEWQKALLPSGCAKEELKKVGIDICKRLYPYLEFKKGQDADSVLICEYLRRKEKENV